MGTDNLARGTVNFQDLPLYAAGAGIRTPFGTFIPPGSRIAAYVRSTGPQDQDPSDIVKRLVPTLAAALKLCRSGMGDIVIVLPNHTENVTDATMLTNLVAGTRIIGVGVGAEMPVFRWTNTAGQWAVNKNDVVIQGLHLKLEGANGIVKAILVTGSDAQIINNDIEVASGAALKATIALELGAGSDRTIVAGNRFRGTATHNVTDGVKVVAAVSDVFIGYNDMLFSATAGNGLVRVTAAALSLMIANNNMYNTMTASTACIGFADVACDGMVRGNMMAVLNDGTAAQQGILFAGATPLVRCFQNFCSDEKQKSGVLSPAAVAT